MKSARFAGVPCSMTSSAASSSWCSRNTARFSGRFENVLPAIFSTRPEVLYAPPRRLYRHRLLRRVELADFFFCRRIIDRIGFPDSASTQSPPIHILCCAMLVLLKKSKKTPLKRRRSEYNRSELSLLSKSGGITVSRRCPLNFLRNPAVGAPYFSASGASTSKSQFYFN